MSSGDRHSFGKEEEGKTLHWERGRGEDTPLGKRKRGRHYFGKEEEGKTLHWERGRGEDIPLEKRKRGTLLWERGRGEDIPLGKRKRGRHSFGKEEEGKTLCREREKWKTNNNTQHSDT